MSPNSMSGGDTSRSGAFDDRVDLNTKLSTWQVLGLIGRALKLLRTVPALFAGKAVLALLALIPALILPWVAKIIVDQVVLQQPFGETDVPFPPHMMPFVNWVQDLAPMNIMMATAGLLGLVLLLFGSGGIGVDLVQGKDSATQSEGKLSGGESEAGGFLGGIEMLINIRLNQRLGNGLRTNLFERLSRLPMKTLDDHRIGDSIYRVMYDAPDVALICFRLTLEPFFVVLGVVLQLYLLNYSYGRVAPEIVWVSASLVPLVFLFSTPLSGLMRRVSQASRASGTATTNAIEESMSNIHAVQSLGGMKHEKERIEKRSAESFRRYLHVAFVMIGMSLITWSLRVGVGIFVAVLVARQVINGTMSAGDFFVIFNIALAISGSALALGMFWINIQGSVAAVRRVYFFIDHESEEADEGLAQLPEVRQGVRFEHVDLTYPNGHEALRDINLDLQVGELVAIVGPTGAGKTSLAYLIPAYYRPSRGRVLVDGMDITQVSLDSLRAQVSYVFQEHLLLSESIRENLLLANPDATEAELVEACRMAGAMEFIDALPDGLDTVLGRSGDTLSVGQQQRLSIARGLVRNTTILILDEPTAALDPQTENALVNALHRVAEDRLVIVIAHRLSTIRQADRIIFLEDGVVRDVGDHETLMADPDGAYRHFVELQGG